MTLRDGIIYVSQLNLDFICQDLYLSTYNHLLLINVSEWEFGTVLSPKNVTQFCLNNVKDNKFRQKSV